MAKIRREKTLADYVVIAISPVLIMTLVGSLAYFLLAVAYRGQYEARVQWVMFWFVMGAVLVARIAIEQGKEQAHLLGAVLAGVTALFVYRFVQEDAVVIAWILQAVIWWSTWKLTWDCTLIDDAADSSGEGLIEAAGLVGAPPNVHQSPPLTKGGQGGGVHADAGAAERDRERVWRRLFPSSATGNKRPHAPGLWVVYFSLAALPLFGVGQLFIPAADAGRRSYAFTLLAVYVASALGLLLTTSFLGLRRYLRQRKLQMPAAMTATWIGMGTALAVALLLVALLIPRPQGEYTITQWIDKVDTKVREASRFAILRDGKGEGQGRRIGAADPNAKQPGQQPPPQQPPGQQPPDKQPQQPGQPPNAERQQEGQPGNNQNQQPGQNGNQQQDQGQGQQQAQGQGQGQQRGQGDKNGQQNAGRQQGEKGANQQNQQANQQANRQGDQQPNPNQQQANANQPPDAKQNGAKQNDADKNANRKDGPQKPGEKPQQGQNAQAGRQTPPPTPPSGSMFTNLLSSLAPFVKWILYGLLAAVVLYVIYRHWARFVAMLLNLWNELLNLFGFVSRSEAASASGNAESAPELPQPFSSFNDPFLNGTARRMSPSELARYTFEALEAWAREQGLPRPPEQTPLEFAAELGKRLPKASKDVTETAQVYVQVAYARGKPPRDSLDVLERMWRRMNVMANV